jgi:hypothetical protein
MSQAYEPCKIIAQYIKFKIQLISLLKIGC